MEFNEKLQQLRKQRNLTQEQLAEQLYVSRTAISKWESGKGYPNIESLKGISKLFDVSIDELLSGDELISIAATENRSNLSKVFGFIYAVLDIMAIAFILLPLYGQPVGTHIQAVNLLMYTNNTQAILTCYWVIFITLTGLGITQFVFSYLEKEKLRGIISKTSFAIDAIAIISFFATREPYAGALLFFFFVIKVFTLLKEKQIK
ncbi:helix-turn-helix transcriptional regulator [Lacrimispora sp. BS-2]|uniref:Helix-turn-helix transcriptional regulator n=1 Tax=Lacrimispora sp. BS-2 TaxID=3151850 RepID=A0AAU7PR27_9FIRM